MRPADVLSLFVPFTVIAAISVAAGTLWVRDSDRRHAETTARIAAQTARSHVEHTLRVFARGMDRAATVTYRDGVNPALLATTLADHAWLHELDVSTRIEDASIPISPTTMPNQVRAWLPLPSGRRLVADIDMGSALAASRKMVSHPVAGRLAQGAARPIADEADTRTIRLPLDVQDALTPAHTASSAPIWWIEVLVPPPASPWSLLGERTDLAGLMAVSLGLAGIWGLLVARNARRQRAIIRDLKDSRAAFQQYAAIASDWHWEMDDALRLTKLFGHQETSIGVSKAALIGLHYRDILATYATERSLRDPAWGRDLTRAFATHEAVARLPLEWRRPNGEVRVFMINCRPLVDASGRFQGYRGTAVDQTELIHTQEDLRAARDAAEQAYRDKTLFMAGIGHDLQQPLVALSLFTTRLALCPSAAEIRRTAEKMSRTIDSANGMLESLRNLSQLEEASQRPSKKAFPLRQIVEPMASEFTLLCERKGLCLRVVGAVDDLVWSDRTVLDRLLRNLLSNAVRYTTTGTVMLSVRRRSDNRLIQVWDTGRGIPADDLTRIFHDHWRGQPASDPPGLGLGLAVVQRAAVALKHPLNVASHPGRGSVFSLTVPAASSVVPVPLAPSPHTVFGSAPRSSDKYSAGATSL